MSGLKEMDPALQAEFQKLPREKQPAVEKFFESSLVRTVFNIGAGISSPNEGLKNILADEEFVQLWLPKERGLLDSEKQRQYFQRSKKAYANYLAYGAPFSKIPEARFFAASDAFRDYISCTRESAEAGPTFLKILDLLPYTDITGLKFIVENRGLLGALDEQYFAPFMRKDLDEKDTRDTSKKAKEIAEILLTDTLFLPLNEERWRNFVIGNFDKLFVFTSMIWFPWKDIKNYDPVAEYRRLRALSELVSPENMPQTLDFVIAMRSIFSPKPAFSKLLIKIGEEINGGNLKLVEHVSNIMKDKKSPLSSSQTHWLNEFWEGRITFDQLKSLAEKLKSIEHDINELELEKKDPLSRAFAKALEAFSKSEIFLNLDYTFILDNSIFPTESIIAFLKEKGQEGIKELIKLKEKTKRGEFDPSNLLQRDLEYISYLTLSGREGDSYESFSKTQFIEDGKEVSILDSRDIVEARAAAFEAARVYWIIRERVDMRRKVFVLGNNRYGKLFVIDPLRQELELLSDLDLIDRVGSKYVRSHTGKDMKRGSQIFSDNNIRKIASETPDIIVVDGTGNNIRDVDGEKIPRFSSAMMGFYNWVKEFNGGAFDVKPRKPYEITFKSFIESDKVILGDEIISPQQNSSNDPQVIIINATINPDNFPQFPQDLKDHEAGYFDDPEDNVKGRKRLVFTKNGLEEKDKSDEVEYTHAVQGLIEKSLLEMILRKEAQKTNPQK